MRMCAPPRAHPKSTETPPRTRVRAQDAQPEGADVRLRAPHVLAKRARRRGGAAVQHDPRHCEGERAVVGADGVRRHHPLAALVVLLGRQPLVRRHAGAAVVLGLGGDARRLVPRPLEAELLAAEGEISLAERAPTEADRGAALVSVAALQMRWEEADASLPLRARMRALGLSAP